MTDKEKDKKLDELMSIGLKLNTFNKTPLTQMKEYIKMYGEFIESIWQEGYARGHQNGKKAWIEQNKN